MVLVVMTMMMMGTTSGCQTLTPQERYEKMLACVGLPCMKQYVKQIERNNECANAVAKVKAKGDLYYANVREIHLKTKNGTWVRCYLM